MAVGPDAKTQLGLAGTILVGVRPDPANSPRGLIDVELRQRIVAANDANTNLVPMHVRGFGHEFWVDPSTSLARDGQDALIHHPITFETGPVPVIATRVGQADHPTSQ